MTPIARADVMSHCRHGLRSMVGQSLQQSGASVATVSSYAAPQYSPAPTDSRDAPAELDETGRSDWF